MSHVRRAALATAVAGALLVPTLPATAAQSAALPDLRADVNRDGRVSTAPGADDDRGEDRWAADRGAVFLPNIDDDSRRCPRSGDAASRACNDAADRIVNGPADALDLARLRTVPQPRLSSTSRGKISIAAANHALHARLFLHGPRGWQVVTPATRLTAAQLKRGVELGLEATGVVRDTARWNGELDIVLSVTGPGGTRSDRVRLRVAPVLTHHHLQRTERTLVTTYPRRVQQRFVADFTAASKKAGLPAPLRLRNPNESEDPWTQDFVEPGYVSLPAADGRPHGMRVLLRSAQEYGTGASRRPRGAAELYPLRGRDVAVLETPEDRQSDWDLNSMGNLETIPPHTHRGRAFPAGRIIIGQRGKKRGQRPARTMLKLLTSQKAQDPLLLDTSWLRVGHVDEFVQFLPARTRRGWKVGVADPRAGLELLDSAMKRGHGETPMFSWPGDKSAAAPEENVADAARSKTFRADNHHAAQRIEANLDLLKRETGITDADIVSVPALFTRGINCGPKGEKQHWPLLKCSAGPVPGSVSDYGQDRLDPDTGDEPPHRLSAYIPGAANGVLLTPRRYLAPRQWGPVIHGRDIFTDAVTSAYERAGIKVRYLDDFSSHHLGEGEVHCATNTLRDATHPWWRAHR
ncbi:protein-arginine deiminase domain-containing protein [Streptomyces lavendofoliae]|uniref:protein-arginine deiminase domain-containing protein n=1 Tax=Streptomyces lavendofoliae TaxID=67314 RepID=UPI00300F5686